MIILKLSFKRKRKMNLLKCVSCVTSNKFIVKKNIEIDKNNVKTAPQ